MNPGFVLSYTLGNSCYLYSHKNSEKFRNWAKISYIPAASSRRQVTLAFLHTLPGFTAWCFLPCSLNVTESVFRWVPQAACREAAAEDTPTMHSTILGHWRLKDALINSNWWSNTQLLLDAKQTQRVTTSAVSHLLSPCTAGHNVRVPDVSRSRGWASVKLASAGEGFAFGCRTNKQI